jgi:hypothetical protein
MHKVYSILITFVSPPPACKRPLCRLAKCSNSSKSATRVKYVREWQIVSSDLLSAYCSSRLTEWIYIILFLWGSVVVTILNYVCEFSQQIISFFTLKNEIGGLIHLFTSQVAINERSDWSNINKTQSVSMYCYNYITLTKPMSIIIITQPKWKFAMPRQANAALIKIKV